MRSRTSDASIDGRGPGSAGYPISRTVQGLLFAAISGGLFWLVWIYANGLRDPRYLDAGCWTALVLQIFVHLATTQAVAEMPRLAKFQVLWAF